MGDTCKKTKAMDTSSWRFLVREHPIQSFWLLLNCLRWRVGWLGRLVRVQLPYWLLLRHQDSNSDMYSPCTAEQRHPMRDPSRRFRDQLRRSSIWDHDNNLLVSYWWVSLTVRWKHALEALEWLTFTSAQCCKKISIGNLEVCIIPTKFSRLIKFETSWFCVKKVF